MRTDVSIRAHGVLKSCRFVRRADTTVAVGLLSIALNCLPRRFRSHEIDAALRHGHDVLATDVPAIRDDLAEELIKLALKRL